MRLRELLVLIILLSQCGCASGGWNKVDSLRTSDFFSGNVIEIPLSFQYGNRDGMVSTEVATKYSIGEMAEYIRMLSSERVEYAVEEYPSGKLLIKIKGIEGENAIVMLTEIECANTTKEHLNTYSFFSPYIEYSGALIVFPLHLVQDQRIKTYHDTIQTSTKYLTDFARDDFLTFYKQLSDFYPHLNFGGIKIFDNVIIVSDDYVKGESNSMRIEFDETEKEKYFSIHFE